VSTTTILVVLVLLVVCGSAALQFYTYRALTLIIGERKREREAFERAVASGKPVELPVMSVSRGQGPTVSDVEETQKLKVVSPLAPRPPFPAPMVGDLTVKQWMIHAYLNDNIWARFVDSFYVRASSSPFVAPLFADKDMADIKRKFLATLLIMCDKGVDEHAAATLIDKHLHLNMSEAAYDATMNALEETLVQYRVPEETIGQFVPMIDYFRDEMVAA